MKYARRIYHWRTQIYKMFEWMSSHVGLWYYKFRVNKCIEVSGCEIKGSCNAAGEVSALTGMWSCVIGWVVTMFRSTVAPSCLGSGSPRKLTLILVSLTLKMKALWYLKKIGTADPVTQHNITEDLNLNLWDVLVMFW